MIDERELPQPLRERLDHIRSCGNVASLTLIDVAEDGVLCIIVPSENYASGGGWATLTEPGRLFVPTVPREAAH